jgi:hypothetical protein
MDADDGPCEVTLSGIPPDRCGGTVIVAVSSAAPTRLWGSMLRKEMAFERAFVNAGGRLMAGLLSACCSPP